MPEAGRRCRDGVQGLPRHVEPAPRKRHDERVELTLEMGAAERDAAKQRLGVGHGGRPGEDACRCDLAPDSPQGLLAQGTR